MASLTIGAILVGLVTGGGVLFLLAWFREAWIEASNAFQWR